MSRYQYPPLTNETEFEELVNNLCKVEYGIEFQVYGRKGQKQYGIDGHSFSASKKAVVYQCKNKFINRDNNKILNELTEDIKREVESVSAKFTNIGTFIFAHSFQHDNKIQDVAIELNQKYDFNIIVWSWSEIENKLEHYIEIAKQYYPSLFDKNILSNREIKNRFKDNSKALLSSKNQYIDSAFIEVEEIKKIFEFFNNDKYEDNILVLVGNAGIGKTAILSNIQQKLIDEDRAFIAIKSDKLSINSKKEMSEYFGVDDILNSIRQISRDEQIIVLIDQLDALSLSMSSNKTTLYIMLEFIEQLKSLNNVKVVVSIREYDLKNDPIFKSLNNLNIIKVQTLSYDYVDSRLKSFVKESEKLNKTLVELLRTPLNLSIFTELYHYDNSCINIKTLHDLYNKYWSFKVQNRELDQIIRKNILELLNKIVYLIHKNKSIEISVYKLEDEYNDEIEILLSNGVLVSNNKKVSFFHQTFYDYVFARLFIKNDHNSLSSYILSTNQDLSIREQVKQIIHFIREDDFKKYLDELNNILYSDEVRFHIKLLLITYLGSVYNPAKEEFKFLQELFKFDTNFEQYFIESWISFGWFEYFKNIDFFNLNNFKKYNLEYKLENFVNYEPDIILSILDEIEYESMKKEQAIMRCLEKIKDFNEYRLEVFEKYKHITYKSNIAMFQIEEIYKKIFNFNQDYAIELFIEYLNIEIKNIDTDSHYNKTLLDYKWEKIFNFLLEQNNIEILKKLLEFVFSVSQKYIRTELDSYLIRDKVFSYYMLFGGINLTNNKVFYLGLLSKVTDLALENRDIFMEIVMPYKDSRYISIIAFLILGYQKNPKEYKDEIYKLLTNYKLLEDMLFDTRIGYKFALLFKETFNLYCENQKKAIFNAILKIKPKWERNFIGRWDYKEKPKYLGTYRGFRKYKLLYLLNIEDIKKFNYLKEYQELQRKFYWYKLKEPEYNEGAIKSVSSPLPEKIYINMSIKNWLHSMKKYDGKRQRGHNILKGGVVEHSREFKNQIKINPNYYFDLLIQLKRKKVNPYYISYGIEGYVDSDMYEKDKLVKIIEIYKDEENDLIKEAILSIIRKILDNGDFDHIILDFLIENFSFRNEHIISDNNKISIDDISMRCINSFEGRYAELLPLIYKNVYRDKDIGENVLGLINNLIDSNEKVIQIGLLRSLRFISKIDKQLFSKLLTYILDTDKSGILTTFSLWEIHYIYQNKYIDREHLLKYINNSVLYILNLKNSDVDFARLLGQFLIYYHLNEEGIINDKIINEAIKNNDVIFGILDQIFKQEIKTNDTIKVNKAKVWILKFRNIEDENISLYFDYEEMVGLKFVHNDLEFIKQLASSISVRRDIFEFMNYLKQEYYQDTTLVSKIIDILDVLIKNINNREDSLYYDTQSIVEFILELNIRVEDEVEKNRVLDLIDKYLSIKNLRFDIKNKIG